VSVAVSVEMIQLLRSLRDDVKPRECCSKIAEAEAAVSVNEKKWLVMHMHVQLKLDELRAPRECYERRPFLCSRTFLVCTS
jgi:hypothetical protein